MFVDVQIIDNFLDSVMSVCLTKTEIIAGSVDGTIHTFDIRNGRYVALTRRDTLLLFPLCGAVFETSLIERALFIEVSVGFLTPPIFFTLEKYLMTWVKLSTVSLSQMMVTVC